MPPFQAAANRIEAVSDPNWRGGSEEQLDQDVAVPASPGSGGSRGFQPTPKVDPKVHGIFELLMLSGKRVAAVCITQTRKTTLKRGLQTPATT